MASHLWPNVNVGTRKGPLPGAPTVGVLSKHQRVNLCYYASDPDGVLKDTRFILVRAECPYVQFVAIARVISTEKFVVGVTNRREREKVPSLRWKGRMGAESLIAAQLCVM